MCVGCHAKKTQFEAIERATSDVHQPHGEFIDDSDREDVVVSKFHLRCSLCGLLRHIKSPWESHKCPGRQIAPRMLRDLAKYSYIPFKSQSTATENTKKPDLVYFTCFPPTDRPTDNE